MPYSQHKFTGEESLQLLIIASVVCVLSIASYSQGTSSYKLLFGLRFQGYRTKFASVQIDMQPSIPTNQCTNICHRLPDDIWLVDLDATKLISPTGNDQDLPALPEPEGAVLKNHLKQVRYYFAYTFFLYLKMVSMFYTT